MASIQEGTGEGPDSLRTYEDRLVELENEKTTVGTADKLADLCREILQEGRKLIAASKPDSLLGRIQAASPREAEGARGPWIPDVELVPLYVLGQAFPASIVAHVYEDRDGPEGAPFADRRYVGTRVYLEDRSTLERTRKIDALGERLSSAKSRLYGSLEGDSRINARDPIERLYELAMEALREAR